MISVSRKITKKERERSRDLNTHVLVSLKPPTQARILIWSSCTLLGTVNRACTIERASAAARTMYDR